MTALYIILGIIALIVILCSVKVKITAEYGEAFSLDVKWLFVKAHIFPQTEEQKAKKAAKKALKEGPQKEFVKKLASYADCYINDAFGTAHRAHASTALIADYFPNDKMFGYLMEKEVKAIENVLKNAQRPFTAIIGGSKVSSKLGVIKNLLDKVDNLIIGGGMGYTFIKAQGGHIGKSLHEDELMPDALQIMKEA